MAFLSAAEAQVVVGGVKGPGCVAAGMRRPHRAGRNLVEPLAAGKSEQGEDIVPQGLLLQDPAEETDHLLFIVDQEVEPSATSQLEGTSRCFLIVQTVILQSIPVQLFVSPTL